MIVGILQCGHLPEEIEASQGKYSDMIARLLDGHGFEYRVFNVVDGVFPDSVAEADGWIVTGSRHGAYEPLPWIAPLEDLIRAIHAAALPLIGICFGHQVIAQALGGRVEKFSGGWSLGHQPYRFGPGEVSLAAWHQDQVTQPPQGAEVLGSSDFCAHAMLAIGDRILTVQGHPEFDREAVEMLIETRGSALDPSLVADAQETLKAPSDRAAFGDLMAAVLRGASARDLPHRAEQKAAS